MGMPQVSLPNGAPLSLLTVRVDRREESSFHLPVRLSTFDSSWEGAPTVRIAARDAGISTRTVAAGRPHLRHARHGARRDCRRRIDANLGDRQRPGHDGDADGASHSSARAAVPRHEPRGRSSTAGGASREGLVDAGWQDTVLVLPGETVRIKIPFTRHPGLYLYHCHILEHEDMGMMRNFRVI